MKLFHICKYLSLSRTEMEIGTTIYTQYRIPVNKKWGSEEEEDARINEAPARETRCF
ncbi:hypothetical protein HanRHA438_Chr06g0274751 [Helianthus annuus]|uniref:Uncharacterized protein n=1 Tax=Helianthus annuus TaxID=4232 RepID=A0A251UJ94_HELAN|nr:hypothetical protein HanXRQr2_Chr06g0265691 [Helianthus annuus]KAJ0912474.1 hypothetical protein HanRHA438_Chr06g0274751 [Helianthus annuus]